MGYAPRVVLLPLILASLSPSGVPAGTTGGAVATVVGGWDSDALPGRTPRESGAFTGLDAYGALRHRDRVGDGFELRVLGRGVLYPSLPAGASLEGRAGLAWLSLARIHARARFSLALAADVGSSRASRGTDGLSIPIDALSARRIDARTTATATFTAELSPTWSATQGLTFALGGTLRDRLVSGAVRDAGLDDLALGLRTAVTHRPSARTTWDGALAIDRTRLLYVVDARSPTLASSSSPVDLTALSATLGVSLRTRTAYTWSARAGVVLTSSRQSTPGGQDPSTPPVPTATLQLSRRTDDATLTATTGFSYTLVDPRLGAGAGLTADVRWQGRPLPRTRGFDVMLAAWATRSTILGGPNDGSGVLASSASGQLRYALASWIGVVAGVDARASRLSSGDYYPRVIGFLGVSSGFWSDTGGALPTTLAAPAPS